VISRCLAVLNPKNNYLYINYILINYKTLWEQNGISNIRAAKEDRRGVKQSAITNLFHESDIDVGKAGKARNQRLQCNARQKKNLQIHNLENYRIFSKTRWRKNHPFSANRRTTKIPERLLSTQMP